MTVIANSKISALIAVQSRRPLPHDDTSASLSLIDAVVSLSDDTALGQNDKRMSALRRS